MPFALGAFQTVSSRVQVPRAFPASLGRKPLALIFGSRVIFMGVPLDKEPCMPPLIGVGATTNVQVKKLVVRCSLTGPKNIKKSWGIARGIICAYEKTILIVSVKYINYSNPSLYARRMFIEALSGAKTSGRASFFRRRTPLFP